MFNPAYFGGQYFPPVWFAPGDESHLIIPEVRRVRGGTPLGVSRNHRGGKRRRLYDENIDRARARRKHEDEFIILL